MSDRLEELARRRRRLLLRSELLRAELAADHQAMLEALRGVDRAISTARKAAKPVFLNGGGLLLFRRIRGRRVPAAGRVGAVTSAAASRGLLTRALFLVATIRRVLPYLSLARNLWRSRSSRDYRPYADAGAETEHLL